MQESHLRTCILQVVNQVTGQWCVKSLLTHKPIPKITITQVFQICMLEKFQLHLKKKKFIKILYFHCKDLLKNSCAHFSLKTQVQKILWQLSPSVFLLGEEEKGQKSLGYWHSDIKC